MGPIRRNAQREEHDCRTDLARRASPRWMLWSYRLLLYGGLAAAAAAGGPVVRVAAGAVAIFGLLGELDGGVRHLFRMGGLVLAMWLAPTWGPAAGDLIVQVAKVPPIAGAAIGVVTVGLIVLLVTAVVGGALNRSAKAGRWAAPDRMFGGLLGAAEGGLVFAMLCWSLALLERPLQIMRQRVANAEATGHPAAVWVVDRLDSLNQSLQVDPVGQWIRESNPLPEMPAMRTAQQAIGALAEPEAFEALMNSPELREIAALPSVVRHVNAIQKDPELRAAVEQRDLAALFRSPQWTAMMSDAELFEAVTSRADSIRKALADLQPAEKAAARTRRGGPAPVSFSAGSP